MSQERQATDYEIVAEVIGDLPTNIVQNLHTSFVAALYKCIEDLEKKMSDLHPDRIRDIHTAVIRYENHCERSIKHKTDIYQKYLSQQVWYVPEDLDIINKHLKDIDTQKTDEDIDQLDKEIEKMKTKILAQRKFNSIHSKTLQYYQLAHLKSNVDFRQFDKIPTDIAQALDASDDMSDNLLLMKSDVQQIQSSVQNSPAVKNVLFGQGNDKDEESTPAQYPSPSLVAFIKRYGPKQQELSQRTQQMEAQHDESEKQ